MVKLLEGNNVTITIQLLVMVVAILAKDKIHLFVQEHHQNVLMYAAMAYLISKLINNVIMVNLLFKMVALMIVKELMVGIV